MIYRMRVTAPPYSVRFNLFCGLTESNLGLYK